MSNKLLTCQKSNAFNQRVLSTTVTDRKHGLLTNKMIPEVQTAKRIMHRIWLGTTRLHRKENKVTKVSNKRESCNMVHKLAKMEMGKSLGKKN